MGGSGPGTIVGAQGFAIGVADESDAIGDLGRARFGKLEILGFGEEGEPSAESGAGRGGIEAEEIGRAVTEGITCGHGGGESDAGRFDADLNISRKYAGVDFGDP